MKNPLVVVIEKFREMSRAQIGLALALAAILLVAMLGGGTRRPVKTVGPTNAYPAAQPSGAEVGIPDETVAGALDDKDKELKQLQSAAAKSRQDLRNEMARVPSALGANGYGDANPLIAHTAEVAVATKEFARSRTNLEEILERHRGYAAKLRMVGQKNGSVLSATLRVPSTELNPTVSELKSLGDVEREEQAADEITQQRADVEARLTNAQNTLRRLKELLEKQTYPDGNVRELQRQIANAGAEVARIQAERQASENRVVFANVYFTLREEVATPSESLGAQLRGAAAAGFGEAMTSVAGFLVFLIGRGPVVALWCVVLFVPVRWLWRKWAPVVAES